MTDILDARIAELEGQGAHRYDPVRFRYIQSLAARSRGKSETVAALIEQKALAAIHAYQKEFDRERSEAKEAAKRIGESFPEAAGKACKLYENSEFKRVRCLLSRLERSRAQSPLSALAQRFEHARHAPEENPAEPRLDDLLQSLEREALSSAEANASAAASFPPRSARKSQLRSLATYKNTMQTLNSNRVVARAIQVRPETPGPLNGQMLATRSLATLRQLSPEYLSRFVSYIDTLLWLQCAD